MPDKSEVRVKPWPGDWPTYYNGISDPCDALVGPCVCGAWHQEGEFSVLVQRSFHADAPPAAPASEQVCPCCGMVYGCYCHEHPHDKPQCPGSAASEPTGELHQAIMNIPCRTPASENAYGAYERGHRDARHAAAELVLGLLASPAARGEAKRRFIRFLNKMANHLECDNLDECGGDLHQLEQTVANTYNLRWVQADKIMTQLRDDLARVTAERDEAKRKLADYDYCLSCIDSALERAGGTMGVSNRGEVIAALQARAERAEQSLAQEIHDWAEFDDVLDAAGAPVGDKIGRPATIERLEWLKARAERAEEALRAIKDLSAADTCDKTVLLIRRDRIRERVEAALAPAPTQKGE